jgi:hypothetical protein
VKRASLPGYEPVYGAPTMILLSAGDPNGVANTSCSAEKHARGGDGPGPRLLLPDVGPRAFAGEGGPELMKECGVPDGSSVICAVIAGYQDGDAFKSSAPKVRTVNYVK